MNSTGKQQQTIRETADDDRPPVVLRTEQLSLHYGEQAAFEQVNLNVVQGAATVLIGPSGVGKSSFIYCLNRMTDWFPPCRVAGRIWFHGEDILHTRTDTIALRRRIGMVFQQPNPFPMSIYKNLSLPLKQHGIRGKAAIAEKVEAVLRKVALWGEVKQRLHSPALALSGGQQQRLCIARALILEPEVLLLDEPCSALDPISSRAIEQLIKQLCSHYTVVMITHNLAQARYVADFLGLMWADNGPGRLVEFGPARQLFNAPRHPLTQAYMQNRRPDVPN